MVEPVADPIPTTLFKAYLGSKDLKSPTLMTNCLPNEEFLKEKELDHIYRTRQFSNRM